MKDLSLGFRPVGDEKIVVLTGAGISRESGLSTFRDEDGIWATITPEDVATPEAFERNPVLVHDFYNARRRHLLGGAVNPNAAHKALARLEAEWPNDVLIVTQNIDDLHERAGSRNLVHMHGEILRTRCLACEAIGEWRDDLSVDLACAACDARGSLRPHVVWFGEYPFEMERIYAALGQCGLFVSIGTSGHVYPAAAFVEIVRDLAGAHTVELNLEASEQRGHFATAIDGPASETVPAFVASLLKAYPAIPR
ncbi:MAG: NAD-dependent deacylase [Rhodospirillaceae bacterium]|nr:NAD-dependent deacylase [Rhodospirillaceae bacterium]